MILAADVGGTKTHLARYEPGGDVREPVAERKLSSRGHRSLEAMVSEFLPSGARVTHAAIGVAGPVVGGRVDTTNLAWDVDRERLSELLGGAPVTLLNDLEATAWGLEQLASTDLELLHPGQERRGNRALIAAGTGLGEAFLLWDGEGWRPSASEGGHTDFGPRDAFEDELLAWLRAKYGRVSYERILSGPGLADLYRFLADTGRGAASPEVAARFAEADDPAAVVTQAAVEGRCERARLAIERFVEIYGAEAGNLALKALALGGVYVGGGIAPRLREFLRAGSFARAFHTKGRLSPVLERMPVHLVLDARTALWGAASVALREAGRDAGPAANASGTLAASRKASS